MRIPKHLWIILVFLAGLKTLVCAQKPIATNLGATVNSKYEDTYPFLSPDGQILYFCRARHPDNIGGRIQGEDNYDIWFCTKKKDGSWAEAENIGAPLNNYFDNGIHGISQDGNVLLLFNTYEGDKFSGPAAISERTESGWGNPVPIKINRLDNAIFYDIMLAVDARTLLIGMQGKNTLGDFDLYVSFKTNSGAWSEPKNLGTTINTKYPEAHPFLAADGQTLYFTRKDYSQKKANGDIYMTRRLDDTWRKWSTPVKLGDHVNTPQDERDFYIPVNGKTAYISSNKQSLGEYDLFEIDLPLEEQPLPVWIVSGIVKDGETGAHLKAVIETQSKSGTPLIARPKPPAEEYTLILPAGTKYVVKYKVPNSIYGEDSVVFDLTNIKATQFKKQDMALLAKPTQIAGTLINPVTKKPLQGNITALLKDGKEVSAISDANGKYNLKVPGNTETLILKTNVPHFYEATETLTIADKQKGASLSKDFSIKHKEIVCKGRFLDARSNVPVKVKFHFLGNGVQQSKPNDNSFEIFLPVSDGKYSLKAEAFDYLPLETEIFIDAKEVEIIKDQFLIPKHPFKIIGKIVHAQTGTPLQGDLKRVMIQDSSYNGGAFVNENGTFEKEMTKPAEYGLTVKKAGFISAYDKIIPDSGQKEVEITIPLTPLETGATVRLNYIFFETNSAKILPESYFDLMRLVQLMFDTPNISVEIAGHTDNVGKDDDNLKLSNARAAAIRSYFIEKGVAEGRITSIGYGETKPIAENKTETGRMQNRRVEFKIVSQ